MFTGRRAYRDRIYRKTTSAVTIVEQTERRQPRFEYGEEKKIEEKGIKMDISFCFV